MQKNQQQNPQKSIFPNFDPVIEGPDKKKYMRLYRGTGPTSADRMFKAMLVSNQFLQKNPALMDGKELYQDYRDKTGTGGENITGGMGKPNVFTPFTSDIGVANAFGKGSYITAMIPLENLCIYPGNSEGNELLQKRQRSGQDIPVVIGSHVESEVLIPNGTPIASIAYTYKGKNVENPAELAEIIKNEAQNRGMVP